MKKLAYILSLVTAVFLFSCIQDEALEPTFEDVNKLTVYDYMLEDSVAARFTSFMAILESGRLAKTLSAYNPDGNGYTLFLPDNSAIDNFINQSDQFSSLNEIINDQEFSAAFSRYHVVNSSVRSNDFPFGAFSQPTLSGDFLTVSFINEVDTSYYRINNQATVSRRNIEVSNGYVHEIETALVPITFTSYQWLEQNPGFSIFKAAVDLTGLQPAIDFNTKEEENRQAITVLAEPDSIYNKKGINSVDDLADFISPSSTDYTSTSNALYNFVAYHFIEGREWIDNFVDEATNYTTLSEVPLNINGRGLDIAINKGKQVFDTIVYQSDTTIIDFIKFDYDESNVITQTGVIHVIDRVMEQQTPSRAEVTFQFFEEPLLGAYRQEVGTFLIEEGELNTIEWSNADLFFVELGDQDHPAWGNDYLFIEGDFNISYTVPKIVQGTYEVLIRADAFNALNAVIEVFIDGNKVGGLVDLTSLGNANNPYQNISLGTVDFNRYSEHVVEIRPLIPGQFSWDWVRFKPI